jgi:Flp pilus assembly protein TadD
MKKAFTATIVISLLLLTIASAFALVAGPFTKEGALAASQDPVFYNELGFMLAQEGNMEGAQQAFAAAVELDAHYENARKNLAVAAFQNSDYEAAIEHGRILAAQQPGNQNYRFDLAQALVHQARYADADLAKLDEAATIFESLGSYPHAQENAVIVRAVIAEFS